MTLRKDSPHGAFPESIRARLREIDRGLTGLAPAFRSPADPPPGEILIEMLGISAALDDVCAALARTREQWEADSEVEVPKAAKAFRRAEFCALAEIAPSILATLGGRSARAFAADAEEARRVARLLTEGLHADIGRPQSQTIVFAWRRVVRILLWRRALERPANTSGRRRDEVIDGLSEWDAVAPRLRFANNIRMASIWDDVTTSQ